MSPIRCVRCGHREEDHEGDECFAPACGGDCDCRGWDEGR